MPSSAPSEFFPLSLHDALPILRIGEFITDERAVFIVLVGRCGKNVTGHSRHRARRNSARRVLVTQIRLVVVAARRAEFLRARCRDRKSTRLNSSHVSISYAVFCAL